MALEVTVDHPDYPDGTEFGIVGLGVFKNGEAREVTEDEERAFVSFNQAKLGDMLEGNELVTYSGSPLITNVEDIIGKDVSDRPSGDPTAMNLDPKTGEIFAEANISGKVSEPDVSEVAVEPPTTPGTQVVDNNTTVTLPSEDMGGDT